MNNSLPSTSGCVARNSFASFLKDTSNLGPLCGGGYFENAVVFWLRHTRRPVVRSGIPCHRPQSGHACVIDAKKPAALLCNAAITKGEFQDA